ncbi:flavin reductase like domain-containing protein [Lactarius psammicola]|nr:flavin reductase like domain-containing protein [Lactarius psammicola]
MFRSPISVIVSSKRWSSSAVALANSYGNARGLSHKIRALLRETAQPVAVVTSLMPPLDSARSQQPQSNFHGATLSSFTSISMSPHHLVAFSLRVPSRMATTLAHLSLAASSPRTHMVINLLAAPQARTATLFSRPDLHPRPFEDPGVQWSLSPDGFPMLHGCLGALSCRVVGAPWPLNDLAALGDNSTHKAEGTTGAVDAGDVQSELFIAQVMRVEDVPQAEDLVDNTLRTLPLVYHRRGYTTTSERLPSDQKSDS